MPEKKWFHGYLYIRRNNVTINMGNIENYGDAPEITVNTKVKSPATDTQYSKAQKDLTVVDEVIFGWSDSRKRVYH